MTIRRFGDIISMQEAVWGCMEEMKKADMKFFYPCRAAFVRVLVIAVNILLMGGNIYEDPRFDGVYGLCANIYLMFKVWIGGHNVFRISILII